MRYSWRNAITGSTDEARRAGIHIAIIATPIRTNGTLTKVNGSAAPPPYKTPRINRAEMIAHTAMLRDEVFAELGITVLPGARTVLGWTRDRLRAVVTGSSRVEVTQVLPLIGPDAAFDVIFAAEDVARSKPAPDGYLAAIGALGLLPRECVVIEDSVAGIAAGLAAGCHVVAVRAGNFGGWDQSAAHRVLDTLEAFTPSLVEELAAHDPSDYGSGVR